MFFFSQSILCIATLIYEKNLEAGFKTFSFKKDFLSVCKIFFLLPTDFEILTLLKKNISQTIIPE